MSICKVTTYIYEVRHQRRLRRWGRCQRPERPECPECPERPRTFAQAAKLKFWQTSRGKPSLFKLGS